MSDQSSKLRFTTPPGGEDPSQNLSSGDTQAIAELLSNALKMECICVIRRIQNRIIVRIFEPEAEQDTEWNSSEMNDALWV